LTKGLKSILKIGENSSLTLFVKNTRGYKKRNPKKLKKKEIQSNTSNKKQPKQLIKKALHV